MPTIANENLKNIRQGLEVYVHVQQLQNIPLTVNVTNSAIKDTTSLQTAEFDLASLTDLSGAGFPLDGTCRLYDPTETASEELGKIGIRSNVGTSMSVSVSASAVINALTLRVFGDGVITANGIDYEVREFVVIPVDATSITLEVTPSAGNRISIEDMTPGITLDFSNDNLVQCTLDLESDLSLVDSSYPISSIEVQGYYPDDISEAVSNMGDGVPIIYYAGYPGDYSTPRYFYVSEAVTQKNGLITIKGEDASARLEDVIQPEAWWQVTRRNCRQSIYQKLGALVRQAGISVSDKEADPPLVGSNNAKSTVMIKETNNRALVQFLMEITNKNDFYPRFIDAGIPTLRWSAPTPKWDIYKKDIGEFEKVTERNINRLYGDNKELPMHCLLTVASKRSTISAQNVKKGDNYDISYGDNRWYSITYANGKWVKGDLRGITLKALKTTNSKKKKVRSGWTTKTKKYKKGAVPSKIKKKKDYKVKSKSKNYVVVTWKEPKYITKTVSSPQLVVKGFRVTAGSTSNVVTSSRLGVTREVSPLFWGRFISNIGDTSYSIPNYNDVFAKSNKSGSFTYKGNPHMQPRDVFRLYELDGVNYTVCTIESIETKHEDGGMVSTITYREGVY